MDVEQSTVTLQSNISKVEQQMLDLRRGHEQRFADLHKDLAGIVWEVKAFIAPFAVLVCSGLKVSRSDCGHLE